MGENIEVKDVQKTEYLDKNGLDMLWAKVKENTRNQVEAESNRAVEQETRIIETKADKSEFSNYVPFATFTALEKKVSANTAAISNKQNAGNYLHYETLNNEGYYEIPSVCIPGSDGSTKTDIDSQNISVNGNDRTTASIASDEIRVSNEALGYTIITCGKVRHYYDDESSLGFDLNSDGIKLQGGDDNHVLTSNGSTIDIRDYAKKSEITAGGNVDDVQVNGVTVVENKIANIKPATKEELGVVKIGDGLNVTNGTISVDKSSILIDLLSYGVEWDTTVADPACARIGNMSYHKSLPIQSEYKGCLVKNGKVNYYLDPNDWSKKADGTPSVLDGTDGDVMVHIPKFYGKSGSNGNKRWVRITTTKIDSSWVEIPEMFVSAYRITTFDDSGTPKIASVVNTTTNYRGGSNRADYDQYLSTDLFRTDLGKPRTRVSRAEMRTMANNSGQELLCYEFYKWVFYWAYVIEYANFDSQKKFNSELTSDGYHQGGLGHGLTSFGYQGLDSYNDNNPITPCGFTNRLGNFSGEITAFIKLGSDTTLTTIRPNRWRGFENPFGDIFTNLDGIVLKRDSSNSDSNVYTTSDSSKFGDDTSVMNVAGIETYGGGCIKEFDLRETGEIIPKSVLPNGSEYTYKCDKHDTDGFSTDKRTLFVGGCATIILGEWSGLGFFSSIDTVGSNGSAIGFRSVIRA